MLTFVLALGFVFALSAFTLAQTGNNTSIAGHVKDPQGANLPGATVRLCFATGIAVAQTEYGLTFSVWGRDITRTMRIVRRVEAGFCWINEVGPHAFGSPFGGYKKSAGASIPR